MDWIKQKLGVKSDEPEVVLSSPTGFRREGHIGVDAKGEFSVCALTAWLLSY